MAPHRKRSSKGSPKVSTIAVYAGLFALIVAVVAVGYRAPEQTSGVANATNTPAGQSQSTSVDEVVATTIAANLAESTNLSVAPNVAQLAVSTQIKNELPQQANDAVISKPQLLQPVAESRQATTYTVQAGDSTDTIASRFGITKDTLKWANNLTSDTITAGTVLTILPTDGVLYTVKNGDTLAAIADKYKVDQTRIVLYNDLDESGITAGQKIVLPSATLPNNERPGYVAPVVATTVYAGYSSGFGGDSWFIRRGTPGYDGNTYAFGNCTRYAYDRRVELGRSVGARWGNAATWAAYARVAGMAVNNTPSVGAIMQNGGYLGHVAIVEEILANGDIKVSEMNASVAGGGYNIVSGRTVPASYVSQYLFIH